MSEFDSRPEETVIADNFGRRCSASRPFIVTGVSDTSSAWSSLTVASWATAASVTDVP